MYRRPTEPRFASARALILAALLALATGGCDFGAPAAPDPEEILARIGTPPSPVLSPDAALSAFRVAPGFRVELVAAEPLVEDPVAIDWDSRGRLYAVEMRGYMPDLEGNGEDEPVGRVVVLEDDDGDGAMDRKTVFLDGLVMPRAIAVGPWGVLIGEPGTLWLCEDADDDRHCDEKRRLHDFAVEGNVEHSENGLLAAVDNWIYLAKSARRLRLVDGAVVEETTAFRGQWGIDQDDRGRLFYNTNSQFLLGDAYPAEYLERHPGTATATTEAPGISEPLVAGDEGVHGIRVAPGVNRAYVSGELRADGRLARATAVSGLAIQRSGGFGADLAGDVFIPEPANQVVAHFRLRADGLDLRTEHVLYPDPEWKQREFLASTDERFRPADAEIGPDGALYLVDFYRGLIQHRTYVSDYLEEYVTKQGLAEPIGLGRIYRIVREDTPAPPRVLDLAAADDPTLVSLLADRSGWWRDRAQQQLVYRAGPTAVPLLRELGDRPAVAWIHTLWALEGLGALDEATWASALDHSDPAVRLAALDAGTELLQNPTPARVERVIALAGDPEIAVRHRALLVLGELGGDARPLGAMLALADRHRDEPAFRLALLSGSAGYENELIQRVLARSPPADDDAARVEEAGLLGALVRVAFARLQGSDDHPGFGALLDLVDAQPDDEAAVWRKQALVAGLVAVARTPGFERWELDARPALFRPAALEDDGPLRSELAQARRAVTWPGDDFVIGAAPLDEAQQARMERGAVLYEACQVCHGEAGTGQDGIAPSLVASPWVLDSNEWLVRVVLQGLAGPIDVHGTAWDGVMPGHGHDPRFADDDRLAGLLTFLRRSWGNTGDAVEPQTVAEVRTATTGRDRPWTAEELFDVPTDHRLDAYAGRYSVKGFPMTITVNRVGGFLAMSVPLMGQQSLTAQADGTYLAVDPDRGAIGIEFVEGEAGEVHSMQLDVEEMSQAVTLLRVN